MTKKELRREIKSILRHSFTYGDDINDVCEVIINDIQVKLKGHPNPSYRDIVCLVESAMYSRICA